MFVNPTTSSCLEQHSSLIPRPNIVNMASSPFPVPQHNNSYQGPPVSSPCTVSHQNNPYQGPVASSPCTVAQQNNHYQGPAASSPWTLPQQNNSYQACPVPQQNSYNGPSIVPQQNNSYNSHQGSGTIPQQNNFYHNSFNGPVAVLWDIENCPVPSNVCPEDVAGNIRMALRFHPVVQGAVTLFSAYGDFNAFPRRLREGCQRTGVKLVDVPNGRKDAADKAILVDMFLFALDNRPPCSIVLISGDVDFAPALHILGQRGYTVILVIPGGVGVRVSPALCNAGRYVWDWPSVARGQGFVPPADSYTSGCHVSEKADGQDDEASVYRGLAQSHYNSHTGEASNKKPTTEEQPREQPTCFKCRKLMHPGKNCDGTCLLCFRCKQPGHKANQCAHKASPKAKTDEHDEEASVYRELAQSHYNSQTGEASNKKPRTDEQPRERMCFRCKKPFHPGKSCDGADIVCYVCKQPGHKSPECAHKAARKAKEESTTASDVADKVCSLCKQQGQKSNNSAHKSARKAKVKGPMTRARKAKVKGGTASKGSDIKSNECTHKSARKAKEKGAITAGNGADISCFECKQQGHKSNECPHKRALEVKEKGETTASNGAHMVCFACHHLGHLAFECPLKWLGKGKGKGVMIASAGKALKLPKAGTSTQKAPVAPAKHMVAVEPNLVEPIVQPDVVAVEPNLVEPNMINKECPVQVEPNMANEECLILVEQNLAEPNITNQERPIHVEPNLMNKESPIRVEPNMINAERPIRIIDKENRTLRNNKVIPMVKVLSTSQHSEKEIWETESSMREKHPELFI